MVRKAGSRFGAWVLGGVVVLLAGSCSSVEPIEVAADTCIQGHQIGCDCADGASSIRICSSDGVYAACQCASLPESGAGGDGATGGTDMVGGAGGAGGMPSGGSSGQGEAGMAGAPTGGMSGGGMSGGGMSGGMDGGGMSGGNTSGGDGGMTGGASGMTGGDGGSAGDNAGGDGGGDGDGDVEPKPAEPGKLYGPCIEGACDVGLFCAATNTPAGDASYCTATCGGGMGGGQCPDPETGNVEPTCVFGFCLLQGCQGRECPLGTACVQTEIALPGGTRTVAQCIFE